MLIPPSQTAVFIDGLVEDKGGEVAKYRAELMAAEVLLWCIPRGEHYTYLKVTKGPTEVEYKDSLQTQSAGCKAAAQAVLTNLGLLATPVPEPKNKVTKDFQADSYSCGLHVVKWMELELRSRRGEPRLPAPTVNDITKRTNDFIEKIKKAVQEDDEKEAKKTEVAAKKAADKAEKKAKAAEKAAAEAPEPTWATFEEALDAGLKCSSCYYTKWGTKGCRKCMGEWFEKIRIADGKGKVTLDVEAVVAVTSKPAPKKKTKHT